MHVAETQTELAEWTVAEVRALLEITLPLPSHSPQLQLAWSYWRRRKRQQSRLSYRRRHRATLTTRPTNLANKNN